MLQKILQGPFSSHNSQPPNCRVHNDLAHPDTGLNSLVLGHTKPQGIETCAHGEVQIYPEQNPHNLNFIPKVYFAITVHGHS